MRRIGSRRRRGPRGVVRVPHIDHAPGRAPGCAAPTPANAPSRRRAALAPLGECPGMSACPLLATPAARCTRRHHVSGRPAPTGAAIPCARHHRGRRPRVGGAAPGTPGDGPRGCPASDVRGVVRTGADGVPERTAGRRSRPAVASISGQFVPAARSVGRAAGNAREHAGRSHPTEDDVRPLRQVGPAPDSSRPLPPNRANPPQKTPLAAVERTSDGPGCRGGRRRLVRRLRAARGRWRRCAAGGCGDRVRRCPEITGR